MKLFNCIVIYFASCAVVFACDDVSNLSFVSPQTAAILALARSGMLHTEKDLAKAYERGFGEGNRSGYQEGYTSGKQAGWESGSEYGFEQGETQGLTNGEAIGLEKGIKKGKTLGYIEATQSAIFYAIIAFVVIVGAIIVATLLIITESNPVGKMVKEERAMREIRLKTNTALKEAEIKAKSENFSAALEAIKKIKRDLYTEGDNVARRDREISQFIEQCEHRIEGANGKESSSGGYLW